MCDISNIEIVYLLNNQKYIIEKQSVIAQNMVWGAFFNYKTIIKNVFLDNNIYGWP